MASKRPQIHSHPRTRTYIHTRFPLEHSRITHVHTQLAALRAQPTRAGRKGRAVRLQLQFRPPVFVATLIPDQDYLLGAAPDIVDALRLQVAQRKATGLLTSEVTTAGPQELLGVMDAVSEQCGLQGRASPYQALVESGDNVIVTI